MYGDLGRDLQTETWTLQHEQMNKTLNASTTGAGAGHGQPDRTKTGHSMRRSHGTFSLIFNPEFRDL
jgi:hypothetical protein